MSDFDDVQTALERLGANVDAAESHGTLCALLLDNSSQASWLGHTLEALPEAGDVLARERLEVLENLYNTTFEQLNQSEFGLELLLPDESEDFGVRLMGLASWCQGFLYGVGVSGLTGHESLDEQGQECLSDLLEISKLSHDEAASEEAELQFAEISEHVRLAALMLNESLNPVKSSGGMH
ncbi:MAG: YecA family protein [Pseudomonadota bacterium]